MSFQNVYKIIHFYLNYIIIHFKLFKIRQMRFVKFLNNSKKLSPCLALPKVYEYTKLLLSLGLNVLQAFSNPFPHRSPFTKP